MNIVTKRNVKKWVFEEVNSFGAATIHQTLFEQMAFMNCNRSLVCMTGGSVVQQERT
jgi:hypothetical protein